MGDLILDPFFYLVGRLYLFLRYRDIKKRKAILAEKYFDSYREVGADLIIRPIALLGFLLMLVFIGVVIYSVIVHGIT